MDTIDTYMTLGMASGFTAFALFTETALMWTPAVRILFATYCLLRAAHEMIRPTRTRR